MKNIISHNLVLLVVASWLLLLSACNVFDYPEIEEPISVKVSELNGTWRVSKVTQFDQEAIDNGFPEDVQKRDITAQFPFAEYNLAFTLDAQGRPATFLVTPGNAPNFLAINSGSWSVDHPVFTTQINLFDATNPNSAAFRVKRISSDVIALQLLRNAADDANTLYLFYEYEFTKN